MPLCGLNLRYFTLEVNETNSRPSTSSSSGCKATASDGLRTTLGEAVVAAAALAFHSFPRELAQRLLIFFFFLRSHGDAFGVDVVEVGEVVDMAFGVWSSSVGSTGGRFSTSTSSPRACLPLMQGT